MTEWKLVPVEPLQKLVEYADMADDTQYGTVASNVVRDLVSEALATPTPPVVLPPPPQSFLILSRLQSGTEEVVRLDEAVAYARAALAQYGIKGEKCPDGLTPDGPTCPQCGRRRGPSGVDGGSWVHY